MTEAQNSKESHGVNRSSAKTAILSLAALQMAGGLSVAMSSLSEAFPDASTLMIQMSLSGAGFAVILMSFFTNAIYAKFTRRLSAILGVAMLIVVSLTAYFFHPSIVAVFLYSLLLGVASSLYIPAVGSAILDYFPPEEMSRLSGEQSLFTSLGGIAFTICVGLLASSSWSAAYLVYLLATPTLIICILFFPKDPVWKNQTDTKKAKISGPIIKYGMIAVGFIILYSALMSNLSLFVSQYQIGTTVSTGLLSALAMVGGALGGLMFHTASKRLGRYCFVFTFAGLALGFFLMARADSMLLCGIAAVVIGICQGVHMPQCLIAVSKEIKPEQSVLGSSIICCIAPQAGTILSPLLVTNVSTALFGESIRSRYAMVGAASAAIAVALLIFYFITLKRRKSVNEQL